MTRVPAPASGRSILLLACAAALALAGCTAATGESATEAPTPSATAKAVLVIGDSIPYNSSNDCPGCVGFVESYALALSDSRGEPYVGENRSRHDGAQTADILEQITSGELDAPLAAAEIVIVSAGFNDQPPYGPGRACFTDGVDLDTPEGAITAVMATTPECIATETASSAANLKGVLEGVRRQAPDATVLALTAYNSWTGWSELESQSPETQAAVSATVVAGLEAWRTAVCDEVEAIGGTCVDLLEPFNGADGMTPSGDLLAADYTHPSQAGNDRIRDLLLQVEG